MVQLEAIHRFQTEGGRKSINTPNEEPLDPLGHRETLYFCTPSSCHLTEPPLSGGRGRGPRGGRGAAEGGEEQEEQG